MLCQARCDEKKKMIFAPLLDLRQGSFYAHSFMALDRAKLYCRKCRARQLCLGNWPVRDPQTTRFLLLVEPRSSKKPRTS